MILFLASPLWAAAYYLDASVGSSGDGTSWSQAKKTWAEMDTLLDALGDDGAGDEVDVNDGNYGDLSGGVLIKARTDWLTIKAATGKTPIFTKIYIYNTSQINTYLKFDGIKIEYPAPDPMPPDDGWLHIEGVNAYIRNAKYVDIRNCVLVGHNKYLMSESVYVKDSQYVNVYHNDMSIARQAMDFITCADCNFTYNYAHDFSFGSILGMDACTGSNLVVGNHIYKATRDVNDPYYPYNEPDPHPGSGFAVRSSNLTIRNNIFHYLQLPQGLMFYDARPAYSNITFENNLFYDTAEVKFYYCGENVLIRNNTFYGGRRNEGMTNQDIMYKYSNPTALTLYSGYNGNSVEIYNNLFVGMWGLPSPTDANLLFTENYNVFWSRGGTTGYSTTKGANSKMVVWMTLSPTTKHGWLNYFNDIGFTGSTPEYNYATEGIKPFFVNPGFLLNNASYEGGYGADSGLFWNYHLIINSPGINFGDPNNQPSDSLGSLDDANEFIIDDGQIRDATHHSAGAYEYVIPTGENSVPVLGSIGNKTVRENRELVFDADATDADPGDTLYFICYGKPPGATFPEATGVFTWTPTYSQGGRTWTIAIYVRDVSRDSDYETVTITVGNAPQGFVGR